MNWSAPATRAMMHAYREVSVRTARSMDRRPRHRWPACGGLVFGVSTATAHAATIMDTPATLHVLEPLRHDQGAHITLDETRVVIDLYPTVWQTQVHMQLHGPPGPWTLGMPANVNALRPSLGGSQRATEQPTTTLSARDHPDIVLASRDRTLGYRTWPPPELSLTANGAPLPIAQRHYRGMPTLPAPGTRPTLFPFAVPLDWWVVDAAPPPDGALSIDIIGRQPLVRWTRTAAAPAAGPTSTCAGLPTNDTLWNRVDAVVLFDHDGAFATPAPPVDLHIRAHAPPGAVTCVNAPATLQPDGSLRLSVSPAATDAPLRVQLWVPATTTDAPTSDAPGYDMADLPPVWLVHDRLARFVRSADVIGELDNPSWDEAVRKSHHWLPMVDHLRDVATTHPDGSSKRFAAKLLWQLATGCMTSYTTVGDDRVYYDGTGCVPWLIAGVPTDVMPRDPTGPEPTLELYAHGFLHPNAAVSDRSPIPVGPLEPPVEAIYDRYVERRRMRWGSLGAGLFAALSGLVVWLRRRR